MRTTDLAPILLLGIVGCAGQPQSCSEACAEAHITLEGCLPEWGMQWGPEFGYLDGDDFDNWCVTFIDEQLEMAGARFGTLDARQRVDETCGVQLEILRTRSCDDYLTSWGVWEAYTQPSLE